MAISDNYSPDVSVCDGVTTTFTGDWKVLNSSYFRFAIENIETGVQTLLTMGTDYTLSFGETGYSAVTTATYSSAYKAVRYREVALDQTNPYRTSKGFQGKVIEDSFDKLTAIEQDKNDQISRSPKFKVGSTASSFVIDDPVNGRSLKFDTVNMKIVNSKNDIDTVVDDVEAARDAALAAETAAEAAQSASETARSQAQGYATDASNYAAQAASSAAEGLYNDVITITNANSPYTPSGVQEGTLFRCDTSSGAIVVNLSTLAVYGEDMKFGFVKIDSSANNITINRGGTDTINGASSVTLSSQFETHVIIGDLTSGAWIDTIQATAIPNGSVTNAKLAKMAANTIKANATAGAASPTDVALALNNLIGRGSSGNIAAITLDATLTLTGNVLGVAASLFSPVGTSVYQTTGTALTKSTWNRLLFDTEEYDDSGWHSTASNTGRITVDFTGRAQINCIVDFNSAANAVYGITLYKNGNPIKRGMDVNGTGGSSTVCYTSTWDVACASGDYFEIFAWTNAEGLTTGTGANKTSFQVRRIK